MNVLMLSGLAPSREEKFGGIFVAKRYELIKKECKVDLYKFGNEYGKIYNVIRKNILKRVNLQPDEEMVVEGVRWNNVNFKSGIFKSILKKCSLELYYKNMLRKVEKEIDIEKYDLIHAHWAFPTGYIAMLLSEKYNIPYIITAHGSDIHTAPYHDKKVKKNTLKVLEKAEKVIFVSEDLRKNAISIGYKDNNSQVIYNGVDLKNFKVLSKSQDDKSIDTKSIIGYVGRLEYIKGVDRIPLIFKLIKEYNEDTIFLISGSGKYKKEVLQKLSEYNINFEYYDSLTHKDLVEFYNRCDCIIVPSRKDSFCCVGLEAQASGTKVVASKIGGIPECLGEFGIFVEDGLKFESRFAEKVILALNTNMDINAMIERTKMFTWEREVEQELRIYSEVLKKKEGKHE